MNNNNNIGLTKSYISTASAYPPDFDINTCVLAANVTNDELVCQNIDQIRTQYKQDQKMMHSVELNEFKYSNFKIDNERLKLTRNIVAVIDFDLPKVNNIHNNSIPNKNQLNEAIIHTIPDSNDKWWIDVPIKNEQNRIVWIRMLADPGANIGCVNTKFAIDNFKSSIVKNDKRGVIATPNGHMLPRFALWLKFPIHKGYIYAARFLLVNDLPAPILADINMLREWGYKFDDGIPPVFKHKAQNSNSQMQGLDIQMEEKYKVNKLTQKYNECRNLDSTTHVADTIFEKYSNAKLANVSQLYSIPPITNLCTVEEAFHPQIDELFTTTICSNLPDAISMLNGVNLASIDAAATVTQNAIKSHLKLLNSAQLEVDNLLHQVTMATLTLDNALDQIRNINDNINSVAPDSASMVVNSLPLNSISAQSQSQEECEPDPGDLDPWHKYDIWKERLARVDKIGGDLELRNHNLCLIVNNKDPILPQDTASNKKANKKGNEKVTNVETTQNTEGNEKANKRGNKKVKNQINFITSPNHILATPEEIEEAKALHKNAELKFNNLTHLFKYEKEDANKYKNLYKRTKEIMNKYKFRVFALHTYDRKTMKLKKAVRLGLKDEYRNVTHYLEQYPLNREKKLAMINETIELDRNGFWIPIETSRNNIPYTVIAKKPDAE